MQEKRKCTPLNTYKAFVCDIHLFIPFCCCLCVRVKHVCPFVYTKTHENTKKLGEVYVSILTNANVVFLSHPQQNSTLSAESRKLKSCKTQMHYPRQKEALNNCRNVAKS